VHDEHGQERLCGQEFAEFVRAVPSLRRGGQRIAAFCLPRCANIKEPEVCRELKLAESDPLYR
jgi:hypothetical protein